MWATVMLAAAMASVLALDACADLRSPAAPAPSQGQPAPATGPWQVSGTVWLHGASSRTPATGGRVFGWVEDGRGGATTGPVEVDASGRYTFLVPPSTTVVTIQRLATGHQPCAVVLRPTGDVQADVDVVTDPAALGAHLPSALAERQPTLSGQVYEMTPEGRRPVSNAWVWLDGASGLGSLVADTRTDADGRYVLCAMPDKPGLVVQVSAPGFTLFESKGQISGVSTLDVELKRISANQRWTR